MNLSRFLFYSTIVSLLLLGLANFCLSSNEVRATEDSSPKELDQYLAIPDPSFRWEILENNKTLNTWLIELTSQTWHDIVWKHYLLVAMPKKGSLAPYVLLNISGKATGNRPSKSEVEQLQFLAEATQMSQALLLQVPNQPLFGGHYEDDLIGETLLKAIETKDATWPLLFPMTKAAIRAIDTIEQLMEQEKQIKLAGVVVSGASKRGWTTWLTGASQDKRVIALVPMVIDTLNIGRQMPYQIETWGEFSGSISPYTKRNLVQKETDSLSEFEKRLWEIVDPYAYRTRLTMPKLLIHGTNDPYWTVDASRHYWDDLLGVKYMLTIPNAGHGLNSGIIKAITTAAVFAKHATQDGPWPEFVWNLKETEKEYVLQINTELECQKVSLWKATSDTKDFRKAHWTAEPIASDTLGAISIPKPETGHLAFFVEIESAYEGDIQFSLTTQVWRF